MERMSHQPVVRSCRGVGAARADDSTAGQELPPVTVDRAGETLLDRHAKAYLVFYPVVRIPCGVSGMPLVGLHLRSDHLAIRNGPAMPGVEFREHSYANGNAAQCPDP